MSRKSKGTSSVLNKLKDKGPPPSHPSETYKEHRNWLIRSLERNDVEIAALVELNRSLHEAKAKILQSCGELVLLDLGSGRLTLVGNELHEEMMAEDGADITGGDEGEGDGDSSDQRHRLTPAQKDVCVDFLHRMKLRRKLSNRLIRRLNRVAHAMDGNDVSPPLPPRYGDLRLTIDADAVEERIAEWTRQESARERIHATLLMKQASAAQQPHLGSTDLSIKPDEGPTVEGAKDGEAVKPAESTAAMGDDRTEGETETEDQGKVGGSEEKDADAKDTSTDTVMSPALTTSGKESKGEDEAVASSKDLIGDAQGKKEDPVSEVTPPSLKDDYAFLQEYDSAYEKVWDNSTGRFKYTLAEQPVDPEYTRIKHGEGVGATAKIMTVQEREAEYKRWEANILARIPDQPTFEELGLKNRVFHLDVRRKHCLEEAARDQRDAEAASPTKKAKLEHDHENVTATPIRRIGGKELRKKSDDADDDKMNIDTNDSDEEEEKYEEAGDSEKESGKDDDDDDGDDDDDDDDDENDADDNDVDDNDAEEDDSSDMFAGDDDGVNEESGEKKVKRGKNEKEGSEDIDGKDGATRTEDENAGNEDHREDTINEEVRPKRPMSLVAVPSFYEQDLARIRMIHKDMLNTSITNHARQLLTNVTKEYNRTYNLSNELFDTCQRLQHNLTFAIAKGRQELTKATNDYASAFNAAKEAWLKEKRDYDMNRANALMPSKWGRPGFGTDRIQDYIRRRANKVIHVTVGQALADIVDGSLMVANGQASMQPKYRAFVPPPNDPNAISYSEENMTQRQLRVETEYRNQYNAMSTKFQESEAERGRAWRKMMKTKAELDIPHDQSLGGNVRRGKLDLTNYHQIPLPPLRSSSKQTIPRELQPQAAPVASYTPPNTAGSSTSKYSAAKIKARKSADGTVAPVSEPKMTKDGLYLRPAGRTRKGMQWDAVNGVWVPEGSQ